MTDVIKSISTRSFFQLGAELRRENYHFENDDNRQLWIAFFIMFVFFVWAVFALIKYRSALPGWVVVLGIILLFVPAGPLLTLILVYCVLGTQCLEDLENVQDELTSVKRKVDPKAAAAGAAAGGGAPPRRRPFNPRSTRRSHLRHARGDVKHPQRL